MAPAATATPKKANRWHQNNGTKWNTVNCSYRVKLKHCQPHTSAESARSPCWTRPNRCWATWTKTWVVRKISNSNRCIEILYESQHAFVRKELCFKTNIFVPIFPQDSFFYCLVFDPTQKTLLADRGEIRVGSRYQTDVTPLLKDPESDPRKAEELETLVWTPTHSLNDRKIDQFLVVSRSVGTFARALDCSSSVKQPSLHMSAAAASRDITLVSILVFSRKRIQCWLRVNLSVSLIFQIIFFNFGQWPKLL